MWKNDEIQGSASVEAAMVLPFFLCAICTVSMIAHFLLIEASVYHATIQTAKVYARQESCKKLNKEPEQDDLGSLSKMGGFLQGRVIFMRYLEEKEIPSLYVVGGRKGITIQFKSDENYVKVESKYILKVPVPFFQKIILSRNIKVKQRLYTGYLLHGQEDASSEGDETVYVTTNGSVYHTRLTCYHLCIQITDHKKIEEILESSHYRKCEKCMHSSSVMNQIYITKEGDCYHSSLSCSGLKREISAVKKSEISGKRLCSECAKY